MAATQCHVGMSKNPQVQTDRNLSDFDSGF